MKNKVFTYTGKDYLNRLYTEKYTRCSRWIKVDYTRAEEARPFFRHNNKRYYLDDFLRTCSPWSGLQSEAIKAADGEAVNLAGCEAEVYYKPLFIELDDDGEAVRLYRYEGSETE